MWSLKKCFLRFGLLGETRKKTKSFFLEKMDSSLKNLFLTNSQVPKKQTSNLQSNCKSTFSTLFNYTMRLLHMEKCKQCAKLFVFTVKVDLFKNLCFQQHLMCYRIDPITCTILAKQLCEAQGNVT